MLPSTKKNTYMSRKQIISDTKIGHVKSYKILHATHAPIIFLFYDILREFSQRIKCNDIMVVLYQIY